MLNINLWISTRTAQYTEFVIVCVFTINVRPVGRIVKLIGLSQVAQGIAHQRSNRVNIMQNRI